MAGSPGAHVNAAGSNSLLRREIDETTVRRANPVVVDSRPRRPRKPATCCPRSRRGACTCGALAELGEVIAGTRAGRTSSEQITLFESQGMAMQDLIIAAELMRRARAEGVGSEVDVGG